MPDFSLIYLKCTKFNFGWGSTSAPPGPVAVFGDRMIRKEKGEGVCMGRDMKKVERGEEGEGKERRG